MLRNRLRSKLVLVLLAPLLASAGCRPQAPTTPPATPLRPAAKSVAIRFTDATGEAGIDFVHNNGGFGKKYLPETMGGGVAWLDIDGDGWQDLLFVNSCLMPGHPQAPQPHSRLYRNRGDGSFEDVTAGSGLDVVIYGMGAAAADFDADGDVDVFITCLGPNHLFRNDGHGHFTDVTARAGVGDDQDRWRWHHGAIWFDYDRDGWLDLFVARYVIWSPETDQFWGIPGKQKQYCPPWRYPVETCLLYRNRGDGSFEDVSQATGLPDIVGKWFQPMAWDFDGDGWTDVVVTSDTTPTALFHNLEGKRFVDVAPETGVSVSETGVPKAGMGIDLGDWRNSGDEAIIIGNFHREGLSLYESDEPGLYLENAPVTGLLNTSLRFLTFGIAFIDMDLDGWQDLFVANGHIDDYVEHVEVNVTYAQRPLVYRNEGGQRFEEIGETMGAPMTDPLVARGCAIADYDKDGDLDIAIHQNNRAGKLYRNDTRSDHHWLRIRLRGERGNLAGIGARVRVVAGALTQTRTLRAGAHFLSTSEPVVHYGLGAETQADVVVTWPSGKQTTAKGLAADREHTVTAE